MKKLRNKNRKATKLKSANPKSGCDKGLKFFFWNIHGLEQTILLKVLNELVNSPARPDIIALAEYRLVDVVQIENEIHYKNVVNANYRGVNHQIGKIVVFANLTNYKLQAINSTTDEFKDAENGLGDYFVKYGHLAFSKLSTSSGDYLIGTLHLASKVRYDPIAQLNFADDYKIIIKEQKKLMATLNPNYKGTILFGDFNLNPFDIAMHNRKGFHSTNYSDSLEHHFFNPMFSLLGNYAYRTNIPKPPGTYFFEKLDIERPYDIHWNLLDGVIFEPSLKPMFVPQSLRIVEQIGDSHVLYINSKITDGYSDHLPISFEFKL